MYKIVSDHITLLLKEQADQGLFVQQIIYHLIQVINWKIPFEKFSTQKDKFINVVKHCSEFTS